MAYTSWWEQDAAHRHQLELRAGRLDRTRWRELRQETTAAHGAAVWGSAQVTLPTLDVAPPAIFWPKQEIAIDAFHHTVYAVATGLAYELLRNGL